jgi:hypothetical protein
MIQPLAPGGAYTISACTGLPNATSPKGPVLAGFDLFYSISLNESLAVLRPGHKQDSELQQSKPRVLPIHRTIHLTTARNTPRSSRGAL